MIEPVSDALTTSIRPAWSAKNAMISSAMLPNVALRMPPTCGPVSAPSRSVDSPTTHASPRIAAADTTNRTVSFAWSPKSSTIAARLRPTVMSSETRPSGDSCAEDRKAGRAVLGRSSLHPIGRDRPVEPAPRQPGRGARRAGQPHLGRRRRRPGARPRPGRRRARQAPRGPPRARSDGPPATHRRRGRTRPAPGSDPPRRESASAPERPTVDRLVDLGQLATDRRGPIRPARGREVAQCRGDPSRRFEDDRSTVVVRHPGKPLTSLAAAPRQETLERPSRPRHTGGGDRGQHRGGPGDRARRAPLGAPMPRRARRPGR